jgi:hypothetical protein
MQEPSKDQAERYAQLASAVRVGTNRCGFLLASDRTWFYHGLFGGVGMGAGCGLRALEPAARVFGV